MELGILLFVVRDAVDFLAKNDLFRTNGTFGTFTPQQDAMLISVIEASLKNHEVTIPAQVDNVVKMIPLILALAGVK